MKKAVFFDRDGVLIDNSEHYYIWRNDQLKFVDGVFENLKLIWDQGFQLFVVSNQGGISKGQYSKADSMNLNDRIIKEFRLRGVEIADVLFCPHHPDFGNCLCRKPGSVMIERLMARYRLINSASYLVGDRDSDIEAARRAGVEGILIPSNRNMLPFIAKILQ